MSDVWLRRAFRWVFVAFLLVSSAKTFLAGVTGEHEGPHGPIILIALSMAEILAAIAFLIEPLERIACAALIAIFAVAAGLSVMAGDVLPIRFVYYGATAIFLVSTDRNDRARVR
jgi:hypothetical protein